MVRRHKIPIAVKLIYSAFVVVLVPYYWVTYSPWNFLFFCDLGCRSAAVALLDGGSVAGEPAHGGLGSCRSSVGTRLPDRGADHGDDQLHVRPQAAVVRAGPVPSFHGRLPFLLLWMVWRLGYDRRALLGWTLMTWAVLLVSFFLAPPPPAPAENPKLAVNLNYVHGLSYDKPQTVMSPVLWLGIMMVGFPLVLYLPTHLC